MKKIVITLLIIAVIAALSVAYFYHKKSKQPVISTVTVKKGTIVEKAQAIGYIRPRHSNTVKSAVNGTVAEIYHEEGEFVKKGEPLVKIKPEPEPAEYATTYEALSESLANEKYSLQNLQRYLPALKSGLITKHYTDYISAKNTYEAAKAKRILAEQKLALLDKGTTSVASKTIDNIVKSPITGYLLSRNVDVGDPVISLSSAQASTPLFTMANMNDLMFEGSVDEMDSAKLHAKMPATITIGAMPNEKITGNLYSIALQSEQENQAAGMQTQTSSDLPFNISFKVQITNLKLPKDLILRSGYSATADVVLDKAENVLVLPERVLHFKGDEVYVLLPPKKKNEKPIEQIVKIGISDGITAEIKSGIKLGEKILDQPEAVEE